MRITNSMMVNNMLNNLSRNLERMNKYSDQMNTGKKIQVPSDDPVVAARALKLRTDVAQVGQYQKNVKDSMSWMEVTESALDNMGELLKRAKDLALQASTGTVSDKDREIIGKEVTQLKEQLIQLSNTTYAGRYVFSGLKTDTKLLDDNGNYLIGLDPAKDNMNIQIGIADDIQINIVGSQLYGSTGVVTAGTVAPMVNTLKNLETALTTNNSTNIASAVTLIENDFRKVIQTRADIGARYNRLELTENRLETDEYNFTKLMSTNEDADMSEVIMNLKQEENVYKASLSGGARVIQPSLVDFLR